MVFINQIFNGLNSSAILLLTSIGIVIIIGNMGIVNLAHSGCIMIGAYICYIFSSLLNIPFLLCIPIAFLGVGALGFLVNHFMIRKLMGKSGSNITETLLCTYGLSLIFKQVIKMIFGANMRYVEVPFKGTLRLGGVMIPYYNIAVIAVAVIVLGGVYWLLYKTAFGRQMRATTGNRMMTECLGINTSMIDNMTFGLGFGLAGIAGVMVAPIQGVTPYMGDIYLSNAFMNVIVGGANSILGSGAASVLIGEAINMLSSVSNEINAKLLIFTIVIILIRFKPQGLFSRERR